MRVAAGAMMRMLRDPASTRERMSLPFVSVPNACPHSGGRFGGNWLSKIGLYGATWPGKSAQKIQKRSTSVPMITVGERMSEAQPLGSRGSRFGADRRWRRELDDCHSAEAPSRIRGLSAA